MPRWRGPLTRYGRSSCGALLGGRRYGAPPQVRGSLSFAVSVPIGANSMCVTLYMSILTRLRAEHISSPTGKVAMIFWPYEAFRGDSASEGYLSVIRHCIPASVGDYGALRGYPGEPKLFVSNGACPTAPPHLQDPCRP